MFAAANHFLRIWQILDLREFVSSLTLTIQTMVRVGASIHLIRRFRLSWWSLFVGQQRFSSTLSGQRIMTLVSFQLRIPLLANALALGRLLCNPIHILQVLYKGLRSIALFIHHLADFFTLLFGNSSDIVGWSWRLHWLRWFDRAPWICLCSWWFCQCSRASQHALLGFPVSVNILIYHALIDFSISGWAHGTGYITIEFSIIFIHFFLYFAIFILFIFIEWKLVCARMFLFRELDVVPLQLLHGNAAIRFVRCVTGAQTWRPRFVAGEFVKGAAALVGVGRILESSLCGLRIEARLKIGLFCDLFCSFS